MDWGLIGHRWAAELLQTQLQRGNLNHAHLICGPEGVGREALGLALAQAVLCEQPPAPGGWCGECRACRQVPAGGYPDLHRVVREEGKQGISIEQVRELQRQLALSSFAGRGRVALLLDFDQASEGAANALLKTLEEPSGEVVMILTAADREAVPATIASRCQSLTLRSMPVEALADALQRGGSPAQAAQAAAKASDGRPALARRLLADPERMSRLDAHRRLLDEALGSDLAGRFALAEGWKDSGEMEERLGVWIGELREALRRRLSSAPMPSSSGGLQSLTAEGLRQAIDAALAATDGLQRNANLRLTVEAMMLGLPRG